MSVDVMILLKNGSGIQKGDLPSLSGPGFGKRMIGLAIDLDWDYKKENFEKRNLKPKSSYFIGAVEAARIYLNGLSPEGFEFSKNPAGCFGFRQSDEGSTAPETDETFSSPFEAPTDPLTRLYAPVLRSHDAWECAWETLTKSLRAGSHAKQAYKASKAGWEAARRKTQVARQDWHLKADAYKEAQEAYNVARRREEGDTP